MKEVNKVNIKISIAAEKIAAAYSSEDLMNTIEELQSCSNEDLKGQSEIKSGKIADILTGIFGDMSSLRNIMSGKSVCAYLDLETIEELRRTIRRLNRDSDDRLETINTLRSIGEYLTYVAASLNRGFLGHSQALRILTCAVSIYDLCQKMMPYMFDDISLWQ